VYLAVGAGAIVGVSVSRRHGFYGFCLKLSIDKEKKYDEREEENKWRRPRGALNSKHRTALRTKFDDLI
jgi:hypothetical protein